ncbi:MAG: thioredoxin domain-containing protein [Bacteroidia bacterium]
MNESYFGEQKFSRLSKAPACEWLNSALPALDTAVIAELRKKDPARYTYKIYLGCWCEDSQHLVPSFLSIAKEFAISPKRIHYIALDPDKKSPARLEEKDKISFVPTFIVYDGDKEIGRIVETASPNLESVLLGIL